MITSRDDKTTENDETSLCKPLRPGLGQYSSLKIGKGVEKPKNDDRADLDCALKG